MRGECHFIRAQLLAEEFLNALAQRAVENIARDVHQARIKMPADVAVQMHARAAPLQMIQNRHAQTVQTARVHLKQFAARQRLQNRVQRFIRVAAGAERTLFKYVRGFVAQVRNRRGRQQLR